MLGLACISESCGADPVTEGGPGDGGRASEGPSSELLVGRFPSLPPGIPSCVQQLDGIEP